MGWNLAVGAWTFQVSAMGDNCLNFPDKSEDHYSLHWSIFYAIYLLEIIQRESCRHSSPRLLGLNSFCKHFVRFLEKIKTLFTSLGQSVLRKTAQCCMFETCIWSFGSRSCLRNVLTCMALVQRNYFYFPTASAAPRNRNITGSTRKSYSAARGANFSTLLSLTL